MEAFWAGLMIGAVVGPIAAVLALALVVLFKPRSFCPACGAPLPKVSFPRTVRQWLRGHRNCPRCGREVDWKGRPVAA